MAMADVDNFLQRKGVALSELIPGKREMALNVADSREFLKLLQVGGIEIIGGDILVKDRNKMGYCHQVWGSKYHYLSWSNGSEGDGGYSLAQKHIEDAEKLSGLLGGEVWVSFVY
ncbi:hypothetical protein MHM93_18525 [Pseudoalteromonas sp. MM17-2]|uniref:hypothetical protein n=1 Tax=Pseudoalteromonas sp. MM17-2 TaxID=2917753 RepID=UPI001EF6579A|nr:hypothetical protein [Pseudoalteromonas sp. MM17-2]MCG7546171.1 hypothetical protein [Pseudoalteromonas sp. MM17-2]